MKTYPIWTCEECGSKKVGTVHQMRKKYCSSGCVSSAYKKRMIGENNPNAKAHTKIPCLNCGVVFTTYNDGKYCSVGCYHESRRTINTKHCSFCGNDFKPKTTSQMFCGVDCARKSKQRPFLPKKSKRQRPERTCKNCGDIFKYSPSTNKMFCSYQCHLDNGGAQRAGQASIKARMKYGAKKDANHTEIFSVITSKVPAKDFSPFGFGIPDGIAWINNGWHFFDVKNPKTVYGRRGLNKIQKKWAENWMGGPVYLIYTAEEAEQFANGNFESLKRFPDITNA